MCVCVCSVSHSVLSKSFVTPWTVALQAPLSMGFPREEFWSGLPFSPPRDLPYILWHILIYYYSAAAAAKSLQLCSTLCDPRDGSPPGSPVPGIPQARTLEWAAISLSTSPFTLWQIEREKVELVTDFLFLGSKIPVDGD